MSFKTSNKPMVPYGEKAAIYARKSNDDDDRCPDNKSVARQVERGIEYAKSKGFQVSEDHLFVDDGISGAEFNNRPGLSALRARSDEFNVVVMSELSRLGRDATRTSLEVISLREQGVRIFYYLTDEEEKADDATSRMMLQIRTFSAEMEREKVSQRVTDALYLKAEKGIIPGRMGYGYEKVEVDGRNVNGDIVKSHTDHKVNDDEARVVVSIFNMYLAGLGYRKIALVLNGDTSKDHAELRNTYLDGVAPPAPEDCRSGAWSYNVVRDMLGRDRYLGLCTYGRTKTFYQGGSKKVRPSDDYVKVPRPDLRIVSDSLWSNVQEKRKNNKEAYSKSRGGSLPFAVDIGDARNSKYLLSSLGVCAVCGSSYVAIGGTCGSGKNRRKYYKYGCTTRHNKGNQTCSNDHKIELKQFDEAVLEAIEQQVLSQNAIDYVIERAQEILKSHQTVGPDKKTLITKELSKVQQEIDRLIDVAMKGVDSETLAKKITQKESQKRFLEEEKERVTALDESAEFKPDIVRKALDERMNSFKNLMRNNVHTARKALKLLFTERFVVTPIIRDGRKTATFQGSTTVGALLTEEDEENHIGLCIPWAGLTKIKFSLRIA